MGAAAKTKCCHFQHCCVITVLTDAAREKTRMVSFTLKFVLVVGILCYWIVQLLKMYNSIYVFIIILLKKTTLYVAQNICVSTAHCVDLFICILAQLPRFVMMRNVVR